MNNTLPKSKFLKTFQTLNQYKFYVSGSRKGGYVLTSGWSAKMRCASTPPPPRLDGRVVLYH